MDAERFAHEKEDPDGDFTLRTTRKKVKLGRQNVNGKVRTRKGGRHCSDAPEANQGTLC